MDLSIYEDLAHKYAQEQPAMDPNALQVGQSVYNTEGKEYRVVENPEGTTSKVLMPVEQEDPNNPQVQTVEDAELATGYTVQPAEGVQPVTARRKAQEVDWSDIQSLALEVLAYSRREDLKGVTTAVEELTNILLSSMEVPADAFDKAGSVLPEFRPIDLKTFKVKSAQAQVPETSVFPDVLGEEELQKTRIDLSDSLKKDEDFSIGESGFVEVMKDIKDMLDTGYQTVDVILNIGERYPREQGEKVLAEARAQGIL
jgi:hypothetical protein